VGFEQFFADVSSKIIALADPFLSQPDMEREMVSPPAGAYITSFTIYHVLPDLPVALKDSRTGTAPKQAYDFIQGSTRVPEYWSTKFYLVPVNLEYWIRSSAREKLIRKYFQQFEEIVTG
jgi:hypothetical protein